MAYRRPFFETKFSRIAILFIVLVVLTVFQPRFIMEPLRVVLAILARPFETTFSRVAYPFGDTFSLFGSIGDLKRENERLERENLALKGENASLRDIGAENAMLREQLGLLPRQNFTLAAAEIVGRDNGNQGSTFTIDKGSRHGIAVGMPVVVSGNVLIGRIAEVFPYSSRIMLLSNPDSVVNAVTTGSNAQGVVKGEHGLGIILDMVLQDQPLTSGDSVVTSGLGGDLPRGLLVGNIQSTGTSEDRLFQRATLLSPVKFENLRFVFVIQKNL